MRWLDNFSKCYAVAMQSVASGAFRDCAWTGDAFKVYVGPDVDISLRSPGMPDDVFSPRNMANTRRRMVEISGTGWLLYDNSMVKKFNVNNVPLKPVVDEKSHARLHQLLLERRDGLEHFHPTDIHPQNIGSNRGLLLILQKMSQERKADNGDHEFMCVDCNIFLRVLKASDAPAPLS